MSNVTSINALNATAGSKTSTSKPKTVVLVDPLVELDRALAAALKAINAAAALPLANSSDVLRQDLQTSLVGALRAQKMVRTALAQ